MLKPELDAAFRQLIAALAGPDAVPAGGAAGVMAIAMGAGLGAKLIGLSPPDDPELREIGAQLATLLERLRPEFAADCAAFAGVLAARRRRRDEAPRDEADRDAAVHAAWRAATEAPVAVAGLGEAVAALLSRCAGRINPHVASDLAAALELVRAGTRIAATTARDNAQHLPAELAQQVLAVLPIDIKS